ncbi:MAG TPA: polysaccharide biosynthesis/export family protein [Flavitalea sp.]|nr:polysaccharide biosynthesis/export family protein [Flavitalea sp.]
MFSCRTPENLNYLQGTLDTGNPRKFRIPEPIIQKGDLITIVVFSDNPTATQLYNQSLISVGTATAGSGVQSSGYLVDGKGNIQFQGIGTMHVEGLTKDQLAAMLDSKLKDTLLKNPYYNIRFVNFKVTMLGEFKNPGQYSIPAERVSILEAIAMAGDFTEFGLKDKVLVIREKNDEREINYIDLTRPDLFSSPFFYLQQNDVVIVEASKRKAKVNDQLTPRNIGIATSIVSTIAIIITVFRR